MYDISEEDYLKHIGVLGMKWGHHKRQDKSSGSGKPSKNKDSVNVKKLVENNEAILKKNPNAAVVNYSRFKKKDLVPEESEARRKKFRNIAIGVGIGVTVAAAAVIYMKNKKTVDGAVSSFLQKRGKESIKSLPNPNALSKLEQQEYKKFGAKFVKTKQDQASADFIASWIGHDRHRYDEVNFDALDDNDISLKPGQVIKRITKKMEDIHDNTYVSFDEDDNNRYAAFLPAMWKVNNHLEKKPGAYQLSMEAITEIKSPSAKKRVEIFADMIKNDQGVRDYYKFQEFFTKEKNDFSDPLAFAKKNYNKLATGLCDRESPLSKKYLAEVKRRGYNALIDDNDAGRLARSPLMLLDKNAVKKTGTTILTKDLIQKARLDIKPMGNEGLEKTKEILNIRQDFLEKAMCGDIKVGWQTYLNAMLND